MIPTIQRRLRRKKIDWLLITQPENRLYLSNYSAADHDISESSGCLLIPDRGTPLLLTDFRFQLQAESEAQGFEVILYTKGLFPLLKSLLCKLAIQSLAFESSYFLHSQYLKLTQLCKDSGVTIHPLDGFIEKIRTIKSDKEINLIRKSVSLNEQVFQEIYPTIRPGMTERHIAIALENAMRQKGAERPSFETIVAGGPNGALPHAVPGSRKIKPHEPIIIDMGLVLNGYCSDMTRTVVIDTPDPKTIKLFRLVRSAQLAGINALAPGNSCRQVDSAARDIIVRGGFGANFGHALGHGVGLAVHEAPSLSSRTRKTLRSGMVVTIEPGIYLPGWGGIRLENMAVITGHGHDILNTDTTFLDI